MRVVSYHVLQSSIGLGVSQPPIIPRKHLHPSLAASSSRQAVTFFGELIATLTVVSSIFRILRFFLCGCFVFSAIRRLFFIFHRKFFHFFHHGFWNRVLQDHIRFIIRVSVEAPLCLRELFFSR